METLSVLKQAFNDKDHFRESVHTCMKINKHAFGLSLVWMVYTIFLYATNPLINVEGEYKLYKFANPNVTFSPESNYGFSQWKYGSDAHGAQWLDFAFIIIPASMSPITPLLCVVGFSSAFGNSLVFKLAFAFFIFLCLISVYQFGTLANFNGNEATLAFQGLLNLLQRVVNSLVAVIVLVMVYAGQYASGCKDKCNYFAKVCLCNLVAMVFGAVVFGTVIFPLFTNPDTSDFLRIMIAAFGANGALYFVFAFGRVAAIRVEEMEGHRGWGVIYFVVALAAVFGRALLTGISGSTADVGLSVVARLPMLGIAIGTEWFRFMTRTFTLTQDRIFFRCCFGKDKVVPKLNKGENGTPAPSPEPPAPAEDGATKAVRASLTIRGARVSSLKSEASFRKRLDASHFISESYLLVAMFEIASITFCTSNVMMIEYSVTHIPFGDAFGSFVINFIMQMGSQQLFFLLFIMYRSVKSNFHFHSHVDGSIMEMIYLSFWLIFTLGPWVCSNCNTIIIDNILR